VSSDTEMGGASPTFPTTRPSFVESMSSAVDGTRAQAEGVLVRTYWKPVYKYVRLRFRKHNEDAKDLTQGFLAHVLEKGWIARFDPRRGSFRAFLRLALDGFVANEHKAGAREKRGGGRSALDLDFDSAEGELAHLEPITADGVEAWFDAQWRRELFSAALLELERASQDSGQSVRMEIFRRYDLADDAETRPTYARLGHELGLDEFAVTNHLSAARRKLRSILVEQLRAQTNDEAEFQSELRALLGGR
jgi:DNA-directed RNA polymerase specialized sigma24 family protein